MKLYILCFLLFAASAFGQIAGGLPDLTVPPPEVKAILPPSLQADKKVEQVAMLMLICIPLLAQFLKARFSEYSKYIPAVAPLLAAISAFILENLQVISLPPQYAAVLGLAAVGLRELVVKLKPVTAHNIQVEKESLERKLASLNSATETTVSRMATKVGMLFLTLTLTVAPVGLVAVSTTGCAFFRPAQIEGDAYLAGIQQTRDHFFDTLHLLFETEKKHRDILWKADPSIKKYADYCRQMEESWSNQIDDLIKEYRKTSALMPGTDGNLEGVKSKIDHLLSVFTKVGLEVEKFQTSAKLKVKEAR